MAETAVRPFYLGELLKLTYDESITDPIVEEAIEDLYVDALNGELSVPSELKKDQMQDWMLARACRNACITRRARMEAMRADFIGSKEDAA